MSQEIKQIRLNLKESSQPNDKPNAGFKSKKVSKDMPYSHDDWAGTVKGKTKHTYKAGD